MNRRPVSDNRAPVPDGLINILMDEGFRLFFPLSALYAGLFPLLWVIVWGFDLPLAHTVPPSFWHGYEMLVGAFGAALIGFLTTAAPEWTDTEPPRGWPLLSFAALWLTGRCVGLFGWDGLSGVGALADVGWITSLIIWVLWLSWVRRTTRLLSFVFWLVLLLGATAVSRVAFIVGALEIAEIGIRQIGLAYLGLLGIALARVTVPVTNLTLDPSERTSPFRPHPGRLSLAPGLVAIAAAGEIWIASEAATGFLLIASGAAFLDRVGESFIGRAAAQTEILLLAGASFFAGCGLILAGASRLGAAWTEVGAWHLCYMGGLGLGVYAVFSIAGLLHSGKTLGVPLLARLGAVCLVVSVCLRVAPGFGLAIPGPSHAIAAIGWCTAFALWVYSYWAPVSARFPKDRTDPQ